MSASSSTGGGGGGGGGGGSTALRAAAANGDLDACIRYLGTVTCVRYTRDETGQSALHLAASGGHTTVVRTLLNVAAPREVNSPDGNGCTALQRAAQSGHEQCVQLLLSRGADVDRQDTIHGNSALHESAWKGYSRTVRLLAAAGAQLTLRNMGGFTALHLSCQNGHNQVCRELLLAGCDPDLQNNYGDTALHTAARYGHAGVTRILISAECRPSEQNKNGDTALHIAAAMGRRKLTRILLEAGCVKTMTNKQNETAQDIAGRKSLDEICRILDQYVNINRSKGRVHFDAASKTKKKTTGKMNKSQVEKSTKSKWSPYGCHYYPDPETFPEPRLDSLPQEPLQRGEQYYLDLAGNIRKGPVGVGYTCYCAPLFQHLQARLDKDKRELQRAHIRLGHKVAGLEQKLARGLHVRRSERRLITQPKVTTMKRSKSLEQVQKSSPLSNVPLQSTRSMDELEDSGGATTNRLSVKQLVERINNRNQDRDSETSEDDGDNDVTNDILMGQDGVPRSRTGLYSPTVNLALIDGGSGAFYQPKSNFPGTSSTIAPTTSNNNNNNSANYFDAMTTFNSRFAKLRVLDHNNSGESTQQQKNSNVPQPNKVRYENVRTTFDNVDRDTNNDSGYSTKVYGSSKGNSPSLSAGHVESEYTSAGSLV